MTDPITTCANHPDRETGLRCNRCGKPICSECAVLTPVGYRCKQCVREQQQQFETARPLDFVLIAVLAAAGGGLGSLLLGIFNLWGVFLAPVVGGGLGDILQRVIRPRRSRNMPWFAAAGVLLGVLFVQGRRWLPYFLQGNILATAAWLLPALLWPGVHAALMAAAVFARMKGIRL